MRRFLKKSLMACATLALSALFTLGAKSVQADAQDGFNLRLDNAGQWHYYTEDGNIDYSYSGMAENEYGWWYITDGTVDFDYNGMAENKYGWWYLSNGTVDWDYNGMAENIYGRWYMKSGCVDWDYYGMAYGPWDWTYVTNGFVNTDYTGLAENEYGWWYITNGYLDYTYNGMAENEYGWWYMTDGGINWDFEGIAANRYGSWWMKAGTVDFSANGDYTGSDGIVYTVVNGYAKVKTPAKQTGFVEEANGDVYYYNEQGMLEQAVGMDVSNYNGQIDWDAVKASGEVKFAIIRVGYGDDIASQDDKRAVYNMNECERVGIPYGVYLFSYAVSTDEAYSEAAHVLRMLQGRKPILGVYLDVENQSYDDGSNYYQKHGLDPYSEDGRRRLTDYTKIVLSAVTNAGYKAGIYMNQNYYCNVLYMNELAGYRWLAAWGDYGSCPIEGCKMWQYTSDGKVTGVPSERVDMNYWLNN